jgi:DNA repair protein RecO (recombination protein O)
LDSTNFSYYLAEIIDKMTEENEKHPEIYDLLEETLENINDGSSDLLLTYFELNFLSESGFRPELYKCLSCSKKVLANETYFSLESGGLVCKTCQKDGKKISEKAVKVLRLFLEHKISVLNKIKTDQKLTNEIEILVKDYLKHTSQREFKSARFLR